MEILRLGGRVSLSDESTEGDTAMSAGLDPVRKAVLIDMAYEIGGQGLAEFPHMLRAIRVGNWELAVSELRNSALYSQVPTRENMNCEMLRTGLWPLGIISAEQLIKSHEGLILKAQPDKKGKWAIGYGHDIVPPAGNALFCTLEDAEAWFQGDFSLAESRAKADLGQDAWGQD